MDHLNELNNIKNLNKEPLHYVFENNLVNMSGLILEFGVFRGGTINYISNHICKNVYGFDSFEGLPESWGRSDMNFDKGTFNLNGNLPSVNSNVILLKGWFNETLPLFLNTNNDPITFLHIDCDIYSSTKTIFNNIKTHISPGCIVIFDELINYPGWIDNEWKAWWELIDESGITFEWIGMNGVPDKDSIKDNGAWDQKVAVKIIGNPIYKFISKHV